MNEQSGNFIIRSEVMESSAFIHSTLLSTEDVKEKEQTQFLPLWNLHPWGKGVITQETAIKLIRVE